MKKTISLIMGILLVLGIGLAPLLTPAKGQNLLLNRAHQNQLIDSDPAGTSRSLPPVNTSFPVASYHTAGHLPPVIKEVVYRDAGGILLTGLESSTSSGVITKAGLVQAEIFSFNLSEGSTFNIGQEFIVAAGEKRMVVEVLETTSRNLDITVKEGDNLVRASTTFSAFEYLDWQDPLVGAYQVEIKNVDGQSTGDLVKLAVAVVPGTDSDNLVINPFLVETKFDLEITWNIADIPSYSAWYGWFDIPGIGAANLDVFHPYADVAKTASLSEANLTEQLTYTITIQPNMSGEDLNYMIEDPLPLGVTYVADSLQTTGSTVNAVYDDVADKITWSGPMETVEYTYQVSDNIVGSVKFSEQCKLPVGTGSYLDLAAQGVDPGADIKGDTIEFQLSGLMAGTQFYDTIIYGDPVFTDDGYIGMYEENFTPWNWYNQVFPHTADPDGIIAPWWRDMNIVYDADSDKGVSSRDYGSAWLVEFDDIQDYYDPLITMDYEIFGWKNPLEPGPDFIIAYDNVLGNWDWNGGAWGSVGLENYDASLGTTYAYDDWTPQSGNIVCFELLPVIEQDPVVITYDAEVNGSNTPVVTNSVAHSADGLGMKTETASVALSVPLFINLDLLESQNKSDWVNVPGSLSNGFELQLSGDPDEFTYLDVADLETNRTIAMGLHPFYIDTTSLPSGFYAYWEAKGVCFDCNGPWQPEMWQIITAQAPMFYLKVSNSEPFHMLIDGLSYLAFGNEDYLRVNGDYPNGVYYFNGTVTDTTGGSNEVSVKIQFYVHRTFLPLLTR